MQKTPGCALLQLAHPSGLLQLLGEDLVQLHPTPLYDLPLDLRRSLLVPDQQDELQLTLAQLVQLLQEDATAKKLLESQRNLDLMPCKKKKRKKFANLCINRIHFQETKLYFTCWSACWHSSSAVAFSAASR